jgi:hypothetical protein
MSSSTKHEQILGELLRDGKVAYEGVRLDVAFREIRVDESSTPVARAIAGIALSAGGQAFYLNTETVGSRQPLRRSE